MEKSKPNKNSAPSIQSGLTKKSPFIICWMPWAMIVTPGISCSKEVFLISSSPEALVPIRTIFPAKKSLSKVLSMTLAAGMIFKFSL